MDRMDMALAGRVVLVTGGSRGIGAETVKCFVSAKAKVAFSYATADDAAEALVKECGSANCASFKFPMSGLEDSSKLIGMVTATFGRIDILVANHGIWNTIDIPIEALPEEQWRKTLSVNVDSVFAVSKAFVRELKRCRQPGKIILLSSTAGQGGDSFHCDYGTSKGAIISFTKGLAKELAGHGIYVNCVAPGWVETDMTAPLLKIQAERAAIEGKIPIGRVATPYEVAMPILFLASKFAGSITGEILNVNGGSLLIG